MYTHTRDSQKSLKPSDALQILKDGNERFRSNLKANRDLLKQVNETREGQWPFAAILSCIDSRTSAELIFDQGLGDIFSVRIAGNIVNDDILGSLEFACAVAGAKVVVVLGHSGCGAVRGACDGVELGHLTAMLEKLQPAVASVTAEGSIPVESPASAEFVESVARTNVAQVAASISERSSVLRDLEAEGSIAIHAAYYDLETAAVEFLS